MKNFHGIPLFILLFACQFSSAQIDTTKKSEVRLSVVGNTHIRPNFDNRISNLPVYSDLSVAYLRKIKTSKYFAKVEISGRGLRKYYPIAQGNVVGEGNLFSNTIFIGAERQSNFKHFGLFAGAGVTYNYVNYIGDFRFPDESPILDYRYRRIGIGVSLQGTMYTNLSDNIFLYLTVSGTIESVSSASNQAFGNNAAANFNGFDSSFYNIDAFGIAYKF